MAVLLTSSRTYPSPPAQAFEVLLPLPLPDLFRHWYGPLPPIRATDETMAWGVSGSVALSTWSVPVRWRKP